MTKQNKSKRKLWPITVMSFGIVFAAAVVIQHLAFDKNDSEYSVNTVESTSIDYTIEDNTEVDLENNAVAMEVVKETTAGEIEPIEDFNDAFAKARKELGTGKTFTWEGKEYSTLLAGEAKKQSRELIIIPSDKDLEPATDAVEEELATNDKLVVNNVSENQDAAHEIE